MSLLQLTGILITAANMRWLSVLALLATGILIIAADVLWLSVLVLFTLVMFPLAHVGSRWLPV